MMAQWDILDEKKGRHFSANAATRQLVRGKEATLGSFVDHQVWHLHRAVQSSINPYRRIDTSPTSVPS